VPPGGVRRGQARGGDLSRSVDARRGRSRAWAHDHLVAVSEDGYPQRRGTVGRRAGRSGPRARLLTQAGRSAGVLREDRGGVRRGPPSRDDCGRHRHSGLELSLSRERAVLGARLLGNRWCARPSNGPAAPGESEPLQVTLVTSGYELVISLIELGGTGKEVYRGKKGRRLNKARRCGMPTSVTALHGSPSRQLELGTARQKALFEQCQRGSDRAARNALVERFLPLARRLARRYAHSSVP